MRTQRRCDNYHSARTAFSLVELMIVMAVLAAVAGLIMPAMRGPLDKSRLTAAAKQMQASLAKARSLAIRESSAVHLRYEIQGSRYVIERAAIPPHEMVMVLEDPIGAASTPSGLSMKTAAPSFTASQAQDGSSDLSGTGLLPGSTTNAGDTTENMGGPVILREGQLPPGVTFADPMPTSPELTASVASLPTQDASASALGVSTGVQRWSQPVRFTPGGRTQDVMIRLVGQRDFVVDVTVRGLTATASYSAPARMLPQQPATAETPVVPEAVP